MAERVKIVVEYAQGVKARNLIIVEGAQGVGKGTITTELRSRLTCTNLVSLAGLPMNSSEYEVFDERLNELQAISNSSSMGWILDRSYITDLVYQRMGKKNYSYEDFESFREDLNNFLAYVLAFEYKLTLVLLKAPEDDFARRLNRPNKAIYENMTFKAESSVEQQRIYEEEMDIIAKYIRDVTEDSQSFKYLKIDTTPNPEDTISIILDEVENDKKE